MSDHHAMVAPLACRWHRLVSVGGWQLCRPMHGDDASSIRGLKDEPDESNME
jgi:hypothetical protein